MLRINCVHGDQIWCKNKNIKRSLFGIGARVCVECVEPKKKCEFKEIGPRPVLPPPSPQVH